MLPARPPRRTPAVVLAAMGAVFLAVSVGPRLAALLREGPSAVQLDALLFTLPFALAGAATLAIGIWFVRSRAVLELTPDEARATEHAGPLRWTRRRRLRDLSRVVVAAWPGGAHEGPGWLFGLLVEFEGGQPRWAGLGYPREKLDELAQHVRRCAPELAGGFELHVPSAGIWKGSKGLVLIGAVFAPFGSGAAGFSVAGGAEALPALLFGGIGGGLVLASVNMGRRTATLRVQGGRLAIERDTLLGRGTSSWAVGEIEDVRRGPSGMRITDRPVLELQVIVRGKKAPGLLPQRDDDELAWVAGELRAALRGDTRG